MVVVVVLVATTSMRMPRRFSEGAVAVMKRRGQQPNTNVSMVTSTTNTNVSMAAIMMTPTGVEVVGGWVGREVCMGMGLTMDGRVTAAGLTGHALGPLQRRTRNTCLLPAKVKQQTK